MPPKRAPKEPTEYMKFCNHFRPKITEIVNPNRDKPNPFKVPMYGIALGHLWRESGKDKSKVDGKLLREAIALGKEYVPKPKGISKPKK
jgi:hypothetical protein